MFSGRERGVVLGDVGLDEAQFDARQRRAGRRHEPERAEGGHDNQRESRDNRRRQIEPALADPPQRRGRGEDRDRQEGEPVQADERSGLGQREIDAERHAEVVPGKAGEQEAARPFGDPEPEREGENAQRSRRPQEARKRKSRGRKDSERRRQRHDRKRQRPGEFVGLDQKRRADPPEAGEKIAEAHPPAGAECGLSDAISDRPGPRSCAPSISQTAMVNGTAISANSDKGGSANAPTAPETKAMARLRQPQDRMIPSMSEARPLARGRMAGIGNAQGIAFPHRSNRHRRP